ncbi:MAG: hypothetical protein QM496_07325 [Verrucomicrobiota bacterium]
MQNNQYQNSLQIASMVRWVFLLAVFGALGASFVYIRNRHVAKGDEIQNYENVIRNKDREIELLELRIAALMDRNELARELYRHDSELREIESNQVVALRLGEKVKVSSMAANR